MQGVVQTQNGDSGSQLGKPSARNQRRLFSKVLPKMLVSLAAPQPVSGGGGGPRAPRAETGNS